MDEDYRFRKGRKVRIGTPLSYFTGVIAGYDDNGEDLFLDDVEEIHYRFLHDCEEPKEYKIKRKKIRIPENKVNHYEFLD